MPCHTSSLLFLLGGGRSPLYPPNKVVLWDDAAGVEVAELEFRERVRGIACRRGWLAVALRRRVAVFEVHDTIARRAEYDTCDNPRGRPRSSGMLAMMRLTSPSRDSCNGYRSLRYVTCDPRQTDGPRAARAPTTLPSPHPSRTPAVRPSIQTAAAATETPGVNDCGTRVRADDALIASIGSITGHHIIAGDPRPHMGYNLRKASSRVS